MYVKIDVLKPAKSSPGGAESKDPNIVIVAVQDILNSPNRDSKGVRFGGLFVFKPGTYAIKIYATPSSIKQNKNADGDEDAVSITQGLEFSHPGDELEINEFEQNWIGKGAIAFIKTGACNGPTYYKVYGSVCAPLQLKFEGQNDNDGTKNTLKFEAFKKTTNVPGFYFDTLTFDAVLSVIAVDLATVDVTPGNGEYQLTNGSVAPIPITDLVNGSHNDVVTLLGSGGTYPSTIAASEAKFVLANGADWTANAGESITFKGYKNGATDADILWIEQSRQ